MPLRCNACMSGDLEHRDCSLSLGTQIAAPALQDVWAGTFVAGAWCVAGIRLIVIKFTGFRETDMPKPPRVQRHRGHTGVRLMGHFVITQAALPPVPWMQDIQAEPCAATYGGNVSGLHCGLGMRVCSCAVRVETQASAGWGFKTLCN